MITNRAHFLFLKAKPQSLEADKREHKVDYSIYVQGNEPSLTKWGF